MRSFLAALGLMLMSPTVFAAQARQVARLAGSTVDSSARLALAQGAMGAEFPVGSDGQSQFILNVRTSSSAIELHCAWDDVIIVRSGSGSLQHSARMRGLVHYGSWEWRARELVDTKRSALNAGDIVRVAAGTGHQLHRTGDAPLVYVVLKIRSPEGTPCGSLAQRGR